MIFGSNDTEREASSIPIEILPASKVTTSTSKIQD